MRFDEDENPWLALQFQGGIAKFDKKTEKFQTWSLPPELNGPEFLTDLMVDGLQINGCTVTVPDGPGLGVRVNEEKIRRLSAKA